MISPMSYVSRVLYFRGHDVANDGTQRTENNPDDHLQKINDQYSRGYPVTVWMSDVPTRVFRKTKKIFLDGIREIERTLLDIEEMKSSEMVSILSNGNRDLEFLEQMLKRYKKTTSKEETCADESSKNFSHPTIDKYLQIADSFGSWLRDSEQSGRTWFENEVKKIRSDLSKDFCFWTATLVSQLDNTGTGKSRYVIPVTLTASCEQDLLVRFFALAKYKHAHLVKIDDKVDRTAIDIKQGESITQLEFSPVEFSKPQPCLVVKKSGKTANILFPDGTRIPLESVNYADNTSERLLHVNNLPRKFLISCFGCLKTKEQFSIKRLLPNAVETVSQ